MLECMHIYLNSIQFRTLCTIAISDCDSGPTIGSIAFETQLTVVCLVELELLIQSMYRHIVIDTHKNVAAYMS